MIAAVAFDFGNVLSGFSHEQGCRQIAGLAGRDADPGNVYEWIYAQGRFEGLETGRVGAEEFLKELAGRFEIANLKELRVAYQQIFSRQAATCGLIAQVTCPRFLASNTDPLHWEEIERQFAADLAHFVAGGLVKSFEVGERKPAPAFFAALLGVIRGKLGEPALSADHVLFVDDLAANCEAAQKCGLRTHTHLNHDSVALAEALRNVGALA